MSPFVQVTEVGGVYSNGTQCEINLTGIDKCIWEIQPLSEFWAKVVNGGKWTGI